MKEKINLGQLLKIIENHNLLSFLFCRKVVDII